MTSCGHQVVRTTRYDVYCSSVALVCLVMGVVFSMIAFFFPVDWDVFVVDPGQTAQENEDRRARQTDTQTAVYVMSLTGVVLVTIGGVISAFLLSKYILLEECVKTEGDEQEHITATTTSGGGLPRPPATHHHHHQQQQQQQYHSANQENKGMPPSSCDGGKNDDGQKHKLVDLDYLHLSGASTSSQYGSTG